MEKPELPKTRRDYEKWLRNSGFSKRRSVRLASAWPSSDEETKAERDEEEAAELQKATSQIRSVLGLNK
ncbi:MAG: hypothetical protein E2P05_00570 [Acidobacteria bacterium]|nr:MAG: hypothetical protein E2P05_00570 [Acidobacteriota bacterium]